MMGVSQSGSTDETERECSMLENNMAGKRFCSLDVFWELDVNLCFGLKAEGKSGNGSFSKRQIQVDRREAGFWLDFAGLLR